MFNIKNIFAIVLSFVTALAFAGETTQISQQALLDVLKAPDQNIVILDVRSKDEYEQGHLNGAVNISHDTIKDNLAQLSQYKNSTVVVYCRSGHRAGIAEQVLAENGFNDLRHLTGDMNGWVNAKLPIMNSKRNP